ncbi:hypothetical protein AAFF_G00169110 [Aldrovandia affinis]|uniref:long-chain-fatty-acid--CoA ligase n=1 Tax=Aldrovandia affinis TaxID=143900 RepID=A0AAD7RM57_9TELE|nr:hypothetical protein AAFF_G00169110 [Aldrovandia affinis]
MQEKTLICGPPTDNACQRSKVTDRAICIISLKCTLVKIFLVMETVLQFLFSPLPTSALLALFALGAAALLWLNSQPKPIRPPIDLNRQTVGIQGGARRSALMKDDTLISYYYEDARTLYEVFQRGLHVSGNGPCLGYRKLGQPYQWLKYKQVSDRAQHLGSGLLHRGLSPSPDQFVGIFAQNRPELTFPRCCVTSRARQRCLLSNCEKGLTAGLKTIILMDGFDQGLTERGSKCGVQILSLREVESVFSPVPQDVSISFLPLAHMFERVVQTVIYGAGARVGFFQGDIRLLPDDMKTLRPTIFPVVPRLLNRVYDKVQSGAQTSFKKWLLNFAIEKKHLEVKRGIIRKDSIWDRLIFHKVQESLGGRVRVMVTGAAPISPSVLSFLRACLGCQIFEAYGQTECTASCTFSAAGDWTAGKSLVCVKGKNVFKGYLKDEDKTAEALDEDGWLHTGDIGKWLPSGALRIIDRKKNIFKLAQGEYIAPEKIENVYVRSGPVAQVFVHGDSLQAFLVGIVVPDPDVLPGFAAKLGVEGSMEELCKNEKLKKAILSDLMKLGKEAGLKSFEQVKDLHLHPEQFSIENGLLTPTLKAKRPELIKLFKTQIDSLYAKNQ